jgi:hypothetical protein
MYQDYLFIAGSPTHLQAFRTESINQSTEHRQVNATSQQPKGILFGLQRAATVNSKGATASL